MTTSTQHENPFEAVLNWLRSGYPDGIPPRDYHPVLALLRRSLTDEQLDKVVDNLHDQISGPAPTTAEIRAAVAGGRSRIWSAGPSLFVDGFDARKEA